MGVLLCTKHRKKSGGENEPEVVLFDLGQVDKENDATIACAEMMAQLNLE